MKRVLCIIVIVAAALCRIPPCLAEGIARTVNEANTLYGEEKYDESIALYNRALLKSPDSEEVNFNIGAGYYRKEDYQSAARHFEKALNAGDKGLAAKTNYNIGNSKYRQGEAAEGSDLTKAVGLYKEALYYYRRAMESDRADKDAKFNYEFLEKKLQMLAEKQRQERDREKHEQEEGQEQKEQDNDGREKGREGQEQSEEQKPEPPQEEPPRDEEDGEEETRERESPRQEEKDPPRPEEEERPQEEYGEMSEEQAMMLLESHKQEEASFNRQRKVPVSDERVLKDW